MTEPTPPDKTPPDDEPTPEPAPGARPDEAGEPAPEASPDEVSSSPEVLVLVRTVVAPLSSMRRKDAGAGDRSSVAGSSVSKSAQPPSIFFWA